MAEFTPNEAQARAIREAGSNILVSAGAGSGKTTVLVERVLQMIIEEGVSIDSLIIVTFTKAAATHMKEKIYNRLRAALKREDLSEEVRGHLKGQLMRVFSARISTIDSLCMDIVRENFQYVNIDPAFRIADEAEVRLLMQDVLKEMIEDHYARPTEGFMNFVSYYTDKNDAKLEDIILSMYRFSRSHPDPEGWIEQSACAYRCAGGLNDEGDGRESEWMEELKKILENEEKTLLKMAEQGLAISDQNYGPYVYHDLFVWLMEELRLFEGTFFDDKKKILEQILEGWKRMPAVKKGMEVDDDLKERASTLYKTIKKRLSSMQEHYYFQDLEQMFLDMKDCAKVAETIADLTLEFGRRLSEEKRNRQIADFNDVAHFALRVLVRKNEDGTRSYTEAADAIARATKEIIVDEYQDTNRLQDALIDALSAARFGRPNVFMVGDVKQSIYGFRMACPDLFLEKYGLYADGKEGKRIILGENYRSRREIVDYINYVFEKIMIPSVGGIDYTDGNQMIAGASFPEPDNRQAMIPEILFIDGGGETGKDAESYEIARKIENLTETGMVADESGEGMRKIRYSDIVILTRKTNNPKLEKMLTDRHIPLRKSSSKGFFAAFEIRLALDLLRVTDNPYQDIALAAVLLSPLAGLTADDLARIKAGDKEKVFRLYDACQSYMEQAGDETARGLRIFFEKLRVWNRRSESLGLESFLHEILEESGLYDICSAMTYGEGRRANLEYLKTLAGSFLKGSYTGLFNFLRYLEAMQKIDVDFGSMEGASKGEDAVTLMTIHKSKGLEFPVVIIADGGKKISDLESASPIYLDDVLGIGIERRDIEKRLRKKTLLMETISAKKKRAIFAEEIRLLYVAMSRAKEKLIITGSKSGMKTRRKEWESEGMKLLPDAGSILDDSSYLYLLADAMKCAEGADLAKASEKDDISKASGEEDLLKVNEEDNLLKESEEELPKFIWTIKDVEEIEIDRAFEIFDEQTKKAEFRRLFEEAEATESERAEGEAERAAEEAERAAEEDGTEGEAVTIDEAVTEDEAVSRRKPETKNTAEHSGGEDANRTRAAEYSAAGIYVFDYPYLSATKANVKLTASQMEHHPEEDVQKQVKWNSPADIKEGLTGAERGNAYHKLFELLDYFAADMVLSQEPFEISPALNPKDAVPENPDTSENLVRKPSSSVANEVQKQSPPATSRVQKHADAISDELQMKTDSAAKEVQKQSSPAASEAQKYADAISDELQMKTDSAAKVVQIQSSYERGSAQKQTAAEVSENMRKAAYVFAKSEIERLASGGHLTAEAAGVIDPEKIADFLLSGIGTRMRKAALEGTLRREQQFVMAAEIDGNPEGLMQGIIDAFFIEESAEGRHLILVDYKTDRNRTEESFILTYRGQQEQYAKALESATGLPVTEMILYSTESGREINLL